ncbi:MULTISPECIES: RNA polymerase sigma factor [Thermaerobacter]|uniref:RNA polymerase sigma factor n=1 Tax=Thermaerobacter composti TaxID=554949 RepID=A0ABZ0QLF5_9FIRM|nr:MULTISPECIES: RNA polymerase sigma factor [Thermaerobacter]WPD18064.1 RNA polymerase sigma factor [Thermaerobacter composti]
MTREAQPTDGELWRQLQEGSQSSLEALVRRYHGPLWAYAWRCTRDYHAAQDLVQETFVTLLEKGHTVQQPGALKQWLFRVLTRRILDWQKAACRREVAGGDTGIPSAESEAPRGRVISLAEVLEGKEQRQRVWVALQELPPAQRAVIVLRFYHDLSLPEIADILGTPVGTVKSRLHYGLRALHARLQGAAPAGRPDRPHRRPSETGGRGRAAGDGRRSRTGWREGVGPR